MSTKLQVLLMDYVSQELKIAYQTSPVEATQEAITKAIETAFEKLDNDIINAGETTVKASLPLSEALSCFALAHAGSCALLGIYDPRTYLLSVDVLEILVLFLAAERRMAHRSSSYS
jgi:hypothetical protein